MPYFKSHDGLNLHYRDWGTGGSPIVFVHGNNCDAAFWEYHITVAAEDGHRTLAPDRRGHGRSDYAATGYDYATYAGDLAALLDHADLHNATLVGHSTGANVILRYLGQYGASRIAGAVLAGVIPLAPIPPDCREGVEGVMQIIGATIDDRPKYFRSIARDFFGSDVSDALCNAVLERCYTIPLEIAVQTVRVLLDPTNDNREDIKAITVPTLFVHGDADTSCPIATAREAHAAMPGSRLIVYEGAPHGLPISERGRFTHDVLAFVESTRAVMAG
jgi:non-heme chloroperoxidase